MYSLLPLPHIFPRRYKVRGGIPICGPELQVLLLLVFQVISSQATCKHSVGVVGGGRVGVLVGEGGKFASSVHRFMCPSCHSLPYAMQLSLKRTGLVHSSCTCAWFSFYLALVYCAR